MEAVQNFVSSFVTKTKESPVQTLLIATAIALTGVGVANYSGAFSFSSKNDEHLLPALTEEEVKKVMKVMVEKLHTTLPQLFRFADQIKQQIAAQGQEIDDATLLKTFLLPNLESAFREIQDRTLEEFDMDEDELEEAVNEYIARGDTELAQMSHSVRAIFKKFGAEINDDEEDGPNATETSQAATTTATTKKKKVVKSKEMSLDEFIKFFRVFQKAQIEATTTALEEFVEEFGTQMDQSTFQIFQQRLLVASQQVQEEVLGEYGLDQQALEKLLTKHQHNPTLQQIVQEMELQTMQAMQSVGLAGFGGM